MRNVSCGKSASNFTAGFKEQAAERQRSSRPPPLAQVANPSAEFGEKYKAYKLRLPRQPPITQYVIWGEGGIYSFANSLRHPINTEHAHRGITPFLPYPVLRQLAARVPLTLSRDSDPPLLHAVIYALIILPSVAIMLVLIFLLIF